MKIKVEVEIGSGSLCSGCGFSNFKRCIIFNKQLKTIITLNGNQLTPCQQCLDARKEAE